MRPTPLRRNLPAHGRAQIAQTENLKRRAEVVDLAFLLLGGRRAGNAFLFRHHPVLAGIPANLAMSSPWGLVEVARVMRREAASQGITSMMAPPATCH